MKIRTIVRAKRLVADAKHILETAEQNHREGFTRDAELQTTEAIRTLGQAINVLDNNT